MKKLEPSKSIGCNNHRLMFDIERLEPRKLLAGNVSATINGAGDLVIQGDGADNDLRVIVDEFGFVDLKSVNGTTNIDLGNLVSSAMSGDIRIDTRGGDDRVSLYSAGVNPPIDAVIVRLGSGDDYLRVEEFHGRDAIVVNGASGNDTVRMQEVISGGLTLQGGGGNDDIGLFTVFPNSTSTNLGSGNDVFAMQESAGSIDLQSSGGDDEIELIDIVGANAKVRTGGGDDSVRLEFFNGTDLDINSGAGNDSLTLEQSTLTAEASLNTGGGEDTIQFKYANLASANVVTGGGADFIGTLESDLDDFGFSMGGGDDSISLISTRGSGHANGGGGRDGVEITNGPNLTLSVQSIENVA